ncbi:MAG: hypothetical protein HYX38_33275, partial [Rhodospirillales bacterium]|nr:hypothetical protein [Rhodospirillales bacterium]
FGQNLNGDGTLGLTTAVIEAVNATTLTQVADTYFLYATGTTTGPQLKYNGAAVSAGQFGLGWTPIGVEASAGGYQVVWRSASDLYAIWNVDSDGNFTSNNHGWLTSISYTLEALETAFSQDLNRDGVMGLSTAFIEGFGDVRLAQVADRYFFYPYPGLSGPQFNYLGAPVTVGQFGGWTPIAVEWAGAGYQVAWRLIGVDNQYRVWDTDVLGNYVRYSLGPVSGSDRILQQAETNFRQDLNGDGFVGLPPRYDINIDYSGDPALRPYFDAAARRWEEIIKGDLPGFDVPGYGFVDDLLISASVTSIDGPGRVLAEAGPDWVRVSGRLPIHGVMRFDSADVMTAINNGSFQDVVLHEMGHVLGIGSLWAAFGLKNGAGSAYFGQYGLEAYHQLGGTGSFVPLETAGGPGTAGMHWSEAVFGNELMTGFISGPNNPLSRMTIGGLRDLGYSVDYGGATPYGIPPWALDGQGGVSSVAADLITTVEQGASRSDAVVDTSEAWWGLPRRFSLDVVFATEDEDENVWPIRTHGAS